MAFSFRKHLLDGQVIPALPLALKPNRRWDEQCQKALVRYYLDAGAGGLAAGVHSTQFAIREPEIGLYKPLLSLAMDTVAAWRVNGLPLFVMIAGLCGRTAQAGREAQIARKLGYDAGLLSLGAWAKDSEIAVLRHCRTVAEKIPLIGFYLQPAVGGRVFSYRFWREFAEIPEVVAIKMAPFNRYRTLDVIRAVLEAGRNDIALYTGNDDNIIADLLTLFQFGGRTRRIAGGLLGQWGVWTERAVALFREIQKAREKDSMDAKWWSHNAALTDANAAIFDAAHNFAGCRPGIHEILRRQGLVKTTVCLDPREKLSRGQAEEITRVARAYPWLVDDSFVQRNLSRWMK